jgi:hypothetical protein
VSAEFHAVIHIALVSSRIHVAALATGLFIGLIRHALGVNEDAHYMDWKVRLIGVVWLLGYPFQLGG